MLPSATQRTSLTVPAAGLVESVDAAAVARLAIALGAGRAHPQDQLDLAAGVELHRWSPGTRSSRAPSERWCIITGNQFNSTKER